MHVSSAESILRFPNGNAFCSFMEATFFPLNGGAETRQYDAYFSVELRLLMTEVAPKLIA